MDEIGRRVRDLRVERSMTQKELGDAAGGLKANYISAVENNKAGNVQINTLQQLADALRVPLKQLFDQPTIEELQARGLPSAFIEQMERLQGTLSVGQRQQLIDMALAFQAINEQPKRRGPRGTNSREGEDQERNPGAEPVQYRLVAEPKGIYQT